MAALEALSTSTSASDEEATGPPINKKAKFAGVFKYKTSFSSEWKKAWPFVSAVRDDPHMFHCNVCSKNLSCSHQGAADVRDHIATKSHQRLVKTMVAQPKLTFHSADPLQDKVTRAKVKVANFMVEHNIPLAVADHLSPLFREIFPDSNVAKKYASCRTKTTSMINLVVAPHFQAALVETMKTNPFSLSVDGSDDTGLEKLNPLTVKIYDVNQKQVSTRLIDMCTTSGRECGTSLALFTKIDSVLVSRGIPWDNCGFWGG